MRTFSILSRRSKYFCFAERSHAYTKEGKYEEAYGLLYRLVQFGENASFTPILINYYAALISTGDYNTADAIKDELVENLRDNLHATAKECELLGDRYNKQKQYIKAILLYQVGEALVDGIETDEMINCLQGCALGLKITVSKLVKIRPDLRSIVSEKVVPAMRRIFDKLCGIMVAEDEKMVLIQSLCLHHIETTELRAEDSSVREHTLREAIALMDQKLGEEACQHKLYSAHLNNLGVACMTQNKADEAATFLYQAIEARKRAKDYDSELEQKMDLTMSKSALKDVEEMIHYRDV